MLAKFEVVYVLPSEVAELGVGSREAGNKEKVRVEVDALTFASMVM